MAWESGDFQGMEKILKTGSWKEDSFSGAQEGSFLRRIVVDDGTDPQSDNLRAIAEKGCQGNV